MLYDGADTLSEYDYDLEFERGKGPRFPYCVGYRHSLFGQSTSNSSSTDSCSAMEEARVEDYPMKIA